jgi:apolipoprotein N-acyltransferase
VRQSNQRVLVSGLIYALLLWVSFPPIGFGLLGLFAIIPLLARITDRRNITRRGYVFLWLAGCLIWLALLQGIRLAYWPLYGGWIALSLYLAVYTPLFVGLARVGLHRLRIPLVVVAPVVWVGLECVRGYFATGFSACLLGHTLINYPICLQIADAFGGYGVSTLVLLVNLLVWQTIVVSQWYRKVYKASDDGAKVTEPNQSLPSWTSLFTAVCLSVAIVYYGYFRLNESRTLDPSPMTSVALIQQNSPTIFEANRERNQSAWTSYLRTTEKAAREHQDIDLVVWPESVFTANEPYIVIENETTQVPPEWADQVKTLEDLDSIISEWRRAFAVKVERVQQVFRDSESNSVPKLLVGQDYVSARDDGLYRFNSAMAINKDGEIEQRYSKTHLVMIGEYIPFADWIPGLYRSLGMAPIRPGREAKSFPVGDAVVAPIICFENVLPHWVHWQQQQLKNAGKPSDLMITITNDGWFRGSSILDHHLNCAIIAAIENRQPMLVAANTGLSAWIDGSGRKIIVSPRMSEFIIFAEPSRDSRDGLWQSIGDWPARICGILTALLLAFSFVQRNRT